MGDRCSTRTASSSSSGCLELARHTRMRYQLQLMRINLHTDFLARRQGGHLLCFSCLYFTLSQSPQRPKHLEICHTATIRADAGAQRAISLFPTFRSHVHSRRAGYEHYNTIHQGMDPGRGGEFFSKTHFYTRTSRSSVKLCMSERRLDEINHTHLVCILGSGGPLTFCLACFLACVRRGRTLLRS
jgi:hypothetical protein